MQENSSKIWLVGTGLMSIEYAKVLNAMNRNFTVIGRGNTNANRFQLETGILPFLGGVDQFLETAPEIPKHAIVAVGIESLSEVCIKLINYGVENILLEKPGFGEPKELKEILQARNKMATKVFLAYNRRFYSSILKARDIAKEDGGITSFSFEFTEWSHVIKTLRKEAVEHRNWFMGNSTHVIDTAFFLGGRPVELSSYVTGSLDWHPSSSIFAGAGVSESGALFSYHANWEGPGRWSIELITKKHRLILKPIESLQIQELGSLIVNPVQIDDELDRQFKPGLFLQVQSFICNEFNDFCDLSEQNEMLENYYFKMSNYLVK